MKIINIFLSVLFLGSSLFAQQMSYKVSEIPEELKKNAKAVIRFRQIDLEVKSPQQATIKVSYAITILNENGIENSFFHKYYDKFTRLSDIKTIIYDKNGDKIKRIPRDEIIDHSAISGYSIYEDRRAKYVDPKYRTVPFTVEYSYEMDFKGLLYFPSWSPYIDYNVSVEKTGFKVAVPEDYKFHYNERNIDFHVKKTQADGELIYTWEAANLPAIKEEPFSLPSTEYMPMVLTAPSDFELAGYDGNCDSWLNFGKWIKRLNEGRDELSEETQNYIRDLVKDAASDYEKVKILYSYLQNKTRYVSIQVGIGGYQPFEAGIVDKYSYGDCKALTNYMKSILNVAGIRSNYCLVDAGTDAGKLVSEFPSTQFNHAFLCVPLDKDTIWLECTNQLVPCGYIGTFTDDRDILLIDDNGGKIVHTKIYSPLENMQIRHANVELGINGNGEVSITTKYTGQYYDDLRSILYSDDADKKKEMYSRIDIPNFELVRFNHEVIKKCIPEVIENADIAMNNYGARVGDRMICKLNLMNHFDELPKKINDRKSDIYIRRSHIEEDSVIYHIPEGYTISKLPTGTTISSKFGEYRSEIVSEGDFVKYIRYFIMPKGIYPVSEYDNFADFFESILLADNVKMVLIRE